jgi:hypothetical protein
MDATSSFVSAVVGAQIGRIQLAVAAKLLQTDAVNADSVVKLVDAAQQSADRLASAAIGLGGNLDINV